MKLKYILLSFIVFLPLLYSCSEEQPAEYEQASRMIQNVYIGSHEYVYSGEEFLLSGVGYQDGDMISFFTEKNVEKYSLTVRNASAKAAIIDIPESFEQGIYDLFVTRGEVRQFLAKVKFYITVSGDVPDNPDIEENIKGIVHCAGKGIAGVRVSDGVKTTVTDSEGYYWLESDKENGYVFYVIPSGYFPVNKDIDDDLFWSPLIGDKEMCEVRNFELEPMEASSYKFVSAADLHLANKQNDVNSFKNGFVTEVSEFCYGSESPVFCMFLGDMTWDRYWYSNSFAIPEYKNVLAATSFPAPVFNVMGNHDNDPYVTGDIAGQIPFIRNLGPNYYSFNIGKAHFVVLDDISWINKGGAEGKVGERDYGRFVTSGQMAWLKEDLEAVADKNSPLFLILHVQLHENYNKTFSNKVKMTDSQGGTEALLQLCRDFSDVHILTGHTHHNSTMVIDKNIIEHNHAAVCETWWWSGYLSGRSICVDGTPAGYQIFTVSGDEVKWQYKAIGESQEKQFIAYDMNTVKEILGTVSAKAMLSKYPSRNNGGNDYGSIGKNEVLINVWNYDPSWTVEVIEGESSLKVERILMRDPLHSIAFDIPRVEKGLDPTSDWASVENSHMFRVVASVPDSDLTIKVTDRFGNVYSEVMERPKVFNISIK